MRVRSSKLTRLCTVSCLTALVLLGCGCSKLTGKSADVPDLLMKDVVVGDGAESVTGENVIVHYVGWVYDPGKDENKGARFDSSRDRGLPFDFTPGVSRVIEGWSKGVPGMKEGGVRILTIPAEMAYGEQQAAGGLIPANSALVFEIELLKVRIR